MSPVRFALFAFSLLATGGLKADTIHVAVASNFAAPMKEIASAFEQATAHKVVLSFASSGKLFAQINHGAPFEIFLSADQTKPNALVAAGLSPSDSQFTYAVGTLMLWSPAPDYFQAHAGDEILASGKFKRLALANPRLAPYGAAAAQTLEALGIKESPDRKWILGENISQTYQFVVSGNVDLGFVALSQVMTGDGAMEGSAWRVPEELYEPVRQDAVLLKRGEGSAAARELLAYLRSPEAIAIIRRYGYEAD